MRLLKVAVLAFTSFCVTTQADTIRLKNGTVIEGTIIQDTGSQVKINADLIGDITVNRSDIDNASGVSKSAPVDSAVKRVVAADPVKVALEEAKKSGGTGHWKRSLSINGNFNSANFRQGSLGPGAGVTGADLGLQGVTYNYGLSAMIIRISPDARQTFEFRGNYNQAEYEPAGKVVDGYGAEASLLKIIGDRDDRYLFGNASYKVDKVANIEHEFEGLLGYGFKLIEDEKMRFDAGPGIAFSQFKKGSIHDNDLIVSAGFFERLEYKFNERVSLEQRLKARVGAEDTDAWKIDTEIKLRASLTENIGFSISGNYIYDNSLGPLPDTYLSAFPTFGIYRPAKKGRLSIQSGVEFGF